MANPPDGTVAANRSQNPAIWVARSPVLRLPAARPGPSTCGCRRGGSWSPRPSIAARVPRFGCPGSSRRRAAPPAPHGGNPRPAGRSASRRPWLSIVVSSSYQPEMPGSAGTDTVLVRRPAARGHGRPRRIAGVGRPKAACAFVRASRPSIVEGVGLTGPAPIADRFLTPPPCAPAHVEELQPCTRLPQPDTQQHAARARTHSGDADRGTGPVGARRRGATRRRCGGPPAGGHRGPAAGPAELLDSRPHRRPHRAVLSPSAQERPGTGRPGPGPTR